MRPTPIADAEILEGHERIVVGPPTAAESRTSPESITGEIRAVEMLRTVEDDGLPIYRARFVCEAGDAERLAAGEPVWLSLWGPLHGATSRHGE